MMNQINVQSYCNSLRVNVMHIVKTPMRLRLIHENVIILCLAFRLYAHLTLANPHSLDD